MSALDWGEGEGGTDCSVSELDWDEDEGGTDCSVSARSYHSQTDLHCSEAGGLKNHA